MKELEGHGFIVERITGIMGPLAWTTQFRLLGFRKYLQRVPVLGAAVVPLLNIVMNIRMTLEDAITPDSIRQTNASVYFVVCRLPMPPPPSSIATPPARESLQSDD